MKEDSLASWAESPEYKEYFAGAHDGFLFYSILHITKKKQFSIAMKYKS